jgi:uncharacterized protein
MRVAPSESYLPASRADELTRKAPILIFNPHDQFDALKQSGRYPRFQEVVRGAERALQGDINPMLAEFGERSEAPQYSGPQVDHEWRCPFQAHRRHDDGQREEE